MLVYLQMMDSPEDESKFEKLYYEYRGLMYQIAYDILQNHEDAEDAVQHAFMKISQNIKMIGNPISFKTKGFVVRIVQNRAIDMYRLKTKYSEVEFIDGRTLTDFDPSISSNIKSNTKSCLKKLPPQYEQVLVLKNFYGLSYKEVANFMNISVQSAYKLEQRAKKRFIQIYEKEGR